jgi:hypothetical protein
VTAIVSESARREALAVERRLDSEQPGYGAEFIELFEAAVRAIGARPRFYPRTEDGPDEVETREYYIERFEYRVIFLFSADDVVEVVALVHARSRPSTWIHRLPGPS